MRSYRNQPIDLHSKSILIQWLMEIMQLMRQFSTSQFYSLVCFFCNKLAEFLHKATTTTTKSDYTLYFYKQCFFFNSVSELLNFFMNWASNVAYVLLNTYMHHDIIIKKETLAQVFSCEFCVILSMTENFAKIIKSLLLFL